MHPLTHSRVNLKRFRFKRHRSLISGKLSLSKSGWSKSIYNLYIYFIQKWFPFRHSHWLNNCAIFHTFQQSIFEHFMAQPYTLLVQIISTTLWTARRTLNKPILSTNLVCNHNYRLMHMLNLNYFYNYPGPRPAAISVSVVGGFHFIHNPGFKTSIKYSCYYK